MDRRTLTTSLFASLFLAACGGGGGGGSTPTAAAPAPSPAPSAGLASGQTAVQLSSNVATWGDSLTEPMARELALIMPSRQVFNGGVVGDTSTEIATRQTADTARRNWVNVFWYGHNNQRDPERIKADIAASVATLAPGNNRYLVLSVVNQDTPDERRGGPVYASILRLNQELAALYPQNYFDMRTFLVNQPGDQASRDNDVPPWALRYDEIHTNYEGQQVTARQVKSLIEQRGW